MEDVVDDLVLGCDPAVVRALALCVHDSPASQSGAVSSCGAPSPGASQQLWSPRMHPEAALLYDITTLLQMGCCTYFTGTQPPSTTIMTDHAHTLEPRLLALVEAQLAWMKTQGVHTGSQPEHAPGPAAPDSPSPDLSQPLLCTPAAAATILVSACGYFSPQMHSNIRIPLDLGRMGSQQLRLLWCIIQLHNAMVRRVGGEGGGGPQEREDWCAAMMRCNVTGRWSSVSSQFPGIAAGGAQDS